MSPRHHVKETLTYWKFYFPINPRVCLLVGWSVGLSVCHNFPDAKLHFHAPDKELVNMYPLCITSRRRQPNITPFYNLLTILVARSSSYPLIIHPAKTASKSSNMLNILAPPSPPPSSPSELPNPWGGREEEVLGSSTPLRIREGDDGVRSVKTKPPQRTEEV